MKKAKKTAKKISSMFEKFNPGFTKSKSGVVKRKRQEIGKKHYV